MLSESSRVKEPGPSFLGIRFAVFIIVDIFKNGDRELQIEKSWKKNTPDTRKRWYWK